ncbi:SHOCT domain-containing protein [Streptomyces sp. NPDC057412]|uniref:SHOCT domain-containing protein n=1 Tax=Streptomyces sp. NPDC057412 TaxID=3346123 RepID=UPI00367F430F
MSAKNLTAGFLTGGASLLATGVRSSDAGTEMIPVRTISSVVTKRDGFMFTKVVVVASGNNIDFRVPHDAAPRIKTLLTDLILGKTPAPDSPSAPAPASAPQPTTTPVEQLRQLAELRDAGILSDEEFTTKKTEILARM